VNTCNGPAMMSLRMSPNHQVQATIATAPTPAPVAASQPVGRTPANRAPTHNPSTRVSEPRYSRSTDQPRDTPHTTSASETAAPTAAAARTPRRPTQRATAHTTTGHTK
jgi:hypothetical protein